MASYSALPEPMLARSGRLPTSGDYAYEVKWDGFRACVLQRHSAIPLTFMAFDVLSVDGDSVTAQPYSERRRILESLRLDAPRWRTPETFDDGAALCEAVCAHELEGVVAKPLRGRYVPGDRGWVKTKNRDYWRYELEREGAFKARRERQFV